MISKTLDQWLQESTKYSSVYYEKYAQAYSDRNCTDEIRNYYCNVSKQHHELRELLHHIKIYGLMSANCCSACKFNPHHFNVLTVTYNKYKKWIDNIIPHQDK